MTILCRLTKSDTFAGFILHSLILVSLLLLSCVQDAAYKTYTDITPQDLGDGWTIATPDSVDIDPAAIAEAYAIYLDENRLQSAKSLMVIRHGKLVAENYCRSPYDRDNPGQLQSATKSLTALALGLARDDGFLENLDTTLYALAPEKFDSDTVKRQITIRDLLTMRSGLEMNNYQFAVEMLVNRKPDPIRQLLAQPRYAAPGDSFLYRDLDAHLAAFAILKTSGKTVEELVSERIFAPLGITQWFWEHDADGNPLGSNGCALRPRDFAKIGKLLLDKGVLGNDTLVSPIQIDSMTAAHTTILHGPDDAGFQYGWYFWVVPELAAYTIWGHGGQFACVVPSKDLLIVMTSMPDSNEKGPGTSLAEFLPVARAIIHGCH